MSLQNLSLALLLFCGLTSQVLIAQDDSSVMQDLEDSASKAKKKMKGKAKAKLKKTKSDAKSKLAMESTSEMQNLSAPPPAPSTANLLSISQYGDLNGTYAGGDLAYATGQFTAKTTGTAPNPLTNQRTSVASEAENNIKFMPIYLWGIYGNDAFFAGMVASIMTMESSSHYTSNFNGSDEVEDGKNSGSIMRLKPFAGYKFGPHRFSLAIDYFSEEVKYGEDVDPQTGQVDTEAYKTTSKFYLGSVGYAISLNNTLIGIELMEGKTSDDTDSSEDKDVEGTPFMAETAVYTQMNFAQVHDLGLRIGYNSFKAPENTPERDKYSGMDLVQFKVQYQYLLGPSKTLYAGIKYFGKGIQNFALDSILPYPLGFPGILINTGSQFAITPKISLLGGVEMIRLSESIKLSEEEDFLTGTQKMEFNALRFNVGIAANL